MSDLSINYVAADTLRQNGFNPNRVDPANLERLRTSLDRLGNFKPVIVREVAEGLEVLGGAHRVQIAQERGERIPIINLGPIDDERAKQIALLDNARFGVDEHDLLFDLVKSLEIDLDELSTFLPGNFDDLDVNLAATLAEIDMETLGLEPESDVVPEKATPTHTTLRFRVPIADAHSVTDEIARIVQEQGFDGASAESAGDALVYFFNQNKG